MTHYSFIRNDGGYILRNNGGTILLNTQEAHTQSLIGYGVNNPFQPKQKQIVRMHLYLNIKSSLKERQELEFGIKSSLKTRLLIKLGIKSTLKSRLEKQLRVKSSIKTKLSLNLMVRGQQSYKKLYEIIKILSDLD